MMVAVEGLGDHCWLVGRCLPYRKYMPHRRNGDFAWEQRGTGAIMGTKIHKYI